MLDLMQQQVIERAKRPLHAGTIAQANLVAEGANPVCGDEVRLEGRIENGRIVELKHQCRACSICSAAADFLVEQVVGKSLAEVAEIQTVVVTEALGIPLSPIRLKCALLPLESLKRAPLKN